MLGLLVEGYKETILVQESWKSVVEKSVTVAPEAAIPLPVTVPVIVLSPVGAATIDTVSKGPSAETDKLFLIER